LKELYIEEYDRLRDEALEAGKTEAEAERIAECGAYDAMTERLYDMADRAKDAWKERDI
jgi:hypothetical protein